MSNVYPAIPDPVGTVESVTESVRALKTSVETLAGQRPGGPAVRVFEQNDEPADPRPGDLWLRPSDAGSTRIWNSGYWVDISNGRFTGVEASVAEVQQTTVELTQTTVDMEAEIATLTTGVAAVQSELDASVAALNADIAAANAEIADARSDLGAAISTLTTDLAAANADIAAANAEIAAVQADLDSSVAALSADITAAQNSVDATVAILNADIAAANADIATVQTQLAANVATINADLASLSDDIAAANADIATANAEIADARSDLEASVALLNADMADAQSELSAIASTITQIQSDVSGNSAAITTEAGARATADTALAGQITSITSTVNSNTAAINAEAITRANADTALAGQITSLTTTVNNNTAVINTESIARADADTALATQITSLTTTVNANTAAITTEATARANADSAISAQLTSLTSTVDGNTAAISSESVTRANADSTLAAQITSLTSTYNSGVSSLTASINSEAATRASADSALSTRIDNLVVSSGSGASAAIDAEATARIAGDEALAAQITTVNAQATARRVFFQTTQPSSSNRIVGDLWINSSDTNKLHVWDGSAWVDSSDGRFSTIAASVTTESAARVSGDNALAAQITSLLSTVNGNTAAITNEATTRANADSALSGQISTVSAQAGAQRVFRQSTAPASSGRIVGDLWFDTGNGSKPYYWGGASWIDNSDSRFATIAASVTTETTARVDGDSALAGQITSLTSTVNNNAAAITSEAATRASADSALSTRIDNLTSTVNTNTAAITSEATTRANADSALSTQLTTVSAQASAQRAFSQTTPPSSTGRIVGDIWFDTDDGNKPYVWTGSAWTDSSDGRFTTIAASVTSEASARTTADSALSTRIDTLTSTVNGNASAITSEATTRANADTALSNQITTVSAQATAQRVFRQTAAPASTGRITGDIWFDTDDGNKPYVWTGTEWVETTDVRITNNAAAITTEATTRANADSALSAQITTVSATASAQRVFSQLAAPSSTGRIVGDLWYDTHDGNKPYYWNGTTWADNSDNRFTAIAASVTSEAATRASADSALSTRIDNLTTTVNGNTSAITTEATTRANADAALSSQITTVSAQATAQRVFRQTAAPASTGRITGDVWFDTDDGNKPYVWTGTEWAETTDARITSNAAAITNEATTRADADTALAGQITSLTSSVNSNAAAITNEAATRANADTALAGQITSLTSSVNSNAAAITNEATTRANADTALSGQITTISAQANAQRVFRQTASPASTGRIVGDIWFDTANGNKPYVWTGSAWTETTDVRITNNAAAITTEATTRANADSALSGQISSLSSTVTNNYNTLNASITSEATTRANADSALSGQITTISAQASAQRVFRQTAAPSNTGRIVGDIWFDTANGNKTYVWGGTAWAETTDVRITDNAAAITTEATTRASADTALSNQLTSLTSTVNSNTAAITSEATTRANADSTLTSSVNTLNSSFTQRVGDQTTFLVASKGLSATVAGTAGLFINGSATSANAVGRSFNVWVINRSNGSIASFNTYDVYSGVTAATAMANALNALDNTKVVAIATFDEPQLNRLSGGLEAAMYRCGASRTIYGNSGAFKIRGAYILVGVPGGGEGSGAERYAGTNNNDTGAFIQFAFILRAGSLVGVQGLGLTSAAIAQESATRTSADTALSNQITSLTSTVNSNTSAISSEATTRANADSALSGQINSLSSTVTNNYNTLNASITNEASTRAQQDNTLAGQISTVSTTVNSNTASITTLQGSVNGLSTQWAVRGSINGTTGGLTLTGIGKADGSGATYNLEINANTTINGNLIVNGTVSNAQLANFAATNSAMSIGAKDTGYVALAIRKNARVALIASYSGNTNDLGSGSDFFTITANDVVIYNAPMVKYGVLLPTSAIAVYASSTGGRIPSNGTTSASSYWQGSYGVWDGFQFVPTGFNFFPSYAFDDNEATMWVAAKSPSPWIKYSYTAGVTIGAYRVTGYSSTPRYPNGFNVQDTTTGQNRAPKAWTLRGSNDGTTWTTIDTRANQTGWGDRESRIFTLASPAGPFKEYSLTITDVVGSSETLVCLPELAFFAPGEVADSENVNFRARVNTTAAIAGYVALYIVELSK